MVPSHVPTTTPTTSTTAIPTAKPTTFIPLREEQCLSTCPSYSATWIQTDYCTFYTSSSCSVSAVSTATCIPTCLQSSLCASAYCDRFSVLSYSCENPSQFTYPVSDTLGSECIKSFIQESNIAESVLSFSMSLQLSGVAEADLTSDTNGLIAVRSAVADSITGVYINDLTISTVSASRRLSELGGGDIEGGLHRKDGGRVKGVHAGREEVRSVGTGSGESYLRKHKDSVGFSHMNNHKNTLNNHAITITLTVSVSLQSLGFVLNPEEASNTTASNAYIFAIDQLRRGVDTGRFTTTLRKTGPQYQSSSSFTGVSALSGSVTTTGPYTLTTPPQSNAQISSLTEFEKLFVPGNTATFIVTVIVVILIGFILLTSGYISFRFIMKSKNNDEDEGGRGSAIWNFFHFIMKSKKIDKDGGGGGSAIGAAVSVSDARGEKKKSRKAAPKTYIKVPLELSPNAIVPGPVDKF
eukprot:CAMPEP_0119046180 /NCGR_PEP_ID=MMETSP1177-20130426/44901_1 /TAXON_ID=2985 /ORGANISM="Ochromonas sp, Strain CCMP1899" /LENGTH=466 /DNA_ID=CAMNT_0007018959 /DNA_START=655 /DNA_END=2055 /DNA_ORIENTATION=-